MIYKNMSVNLLYGSHIEVSHMALVGSQIFFVHCYHATTHVVDFCR